MASPRILTRTRFILAELEGTYGVDPVPTGAMNAILTKTSLAITPMETSQVKRDLITPYLGDIGALLADTYVKLECEIELSGSGVAGTAPGMDPLLQACGMAATIVAGNSVAYAPVSSNFSSATLYFYGITDANTAVLHKITGARGDFELNLATKSVPSIKFTMMGLYNAPTKVAAPTGMSFTKFAKPVIPNSQNTTGLSVFGYAAAALEKFQLKCGNKTEFKNLIGDQYILLSDRQSSGQVDFEAVTPDVNDFFGAAKTSAISPITFIHGNTAGNKVAVSVPAAQLLNPAYSDSNGVQLFQAPFIATPTTGNDEFTLTFT
jgi:hypothetical protein